MKSTKSIIATSVLSVFLAVPAGAAFADSANAKATLGGTPFAITNYGTNVVKGRAELISDNRSANSKVMVKLSGLKPGTTHIGHIHGGSCVQLFPGTIFHNLEPITADNAGNGASKTDIPRDLLGLADCEWWVAFHEGAANATPQTPAIAVGPVIFKGKDNMHDHAHEYGHGRN